MIFFSKIFWCADRVRMSKIYPPPPDRRPKVFYRTPPPSPAVFARPYIHARQSEFSNTKPFGWHKRISNRVIPCERTPKCVSRHENVRIGGVKTIGHVSCGVQAWGMALASASSLVAKRKPAFTVGGSQSQPPFWPIISIFTINEP